MADEPCKHDRLMEAPVVETRKNGSVTTRFRRCAKCKDKVETTERSKQVIHDELIKSLETERVLNNQVVVMERKLRDTGEAIRHLASLRVFDVN